LPPTLELTSAIAEGASPSPPGPFLGGASRFAYSERVVDFENVAIPLDA